MKIKSFKQFLNEFEIEGEHQEGKRYNGTEEQIFHQFIEELADKVNSRGIYDLVEENLGEYSVYELEGYDIKPISVNLSIGGDEQIGYANLLPIISCNKSDTNKIMNVLNKLSLSQYITEEDDYDGTHHILLKIPVGM